MRQHMGRLRVSKEETPPVLVATPHWTLGTWVQNWLDTYGSQPCEPKTLERYRELAEYVTLPERTLAAVDLRELHHGQIETSLFALLAEKAKRREHISATTVRHVGGLLNVVLNKAFMLDLIPV